MEQPQQSSEPKAVVVSSSEEQELEDLRAKCKAQQKRIEFLESFLSQKLEATRRSYAEMKPYFDSQKEKIMNLFFNCFPARLSYDDIIQKFRRKYPMISTAHLPRRIKEMCQEGRLCRSYDEERKKVVFHLDLFPDDRENQHAETTNQKSPEPQRNLGELSEHESSRQNSELLKNQTTQLLRDPEERKRQES